MVASLLETILITNLLVGSSNFHPVPGWVRVLVLRFMGNLVWLPQKSREDKIILNPVAGGTPDLIPPGSYNYTDFHAISRTLFCPTQSNIVKAFNHRLEQYHKCRNHSDTFFQPLD